MGSNHLAKNCHASNNKGYGIWFSGYGNLISGNVCSGNSSIGISALGGGDLISGNVCFGNSSDGIVAGGSNLIGNVVYNNTGKGFSLSLNTSNYYVIDRNTVYQNAGGNINGSPPKAVFGVTGIPSP